MRHLTLGLALVLALPGCFDDEIPLNPPDASVVEIPDDSCLEGCESLLACDLCLPNAAGECLGVAGCAQTCASADLRAELLCSLRVPACDVPSIDACLGGSTSTCERACAHLEGCDQALVSGAQTLSTRGCVAFCDGGGLSAAACLADLRTCQGIDACLGEDGAGDDACARGCRQLDACDLCATSDGGDCLTVAACAAECRAEFPNTGVCLAELRTCEVEAIDACFDDGAGADDCAAACRHLDDCGLCLEDDAGQACLSLAACAATCRAEFPAAAACIAANGACDDDAFDTCFAPTPDVCLLACEAAAGCDLSDRDAGPWGADLDLCRARCGVSNRPDPEAPCLAAAVDCSEVRACLPARPACAQACAALATCELVPPGDPADVQAACEASCVGWPAPQAECVLAGAAARDCAAVAACPPRPEPPPCAFVCGRQIECALIPEADRAACEQTCDEASTLETRICVAEAGEDCATVGACLER